MSKKPRKQKIENRRAKSRLEQDTQQRKALLIGASIIGVLILLIVGYGLLDQLVLQNNRAVARVGEDTVTVKNFQKQVRYARFQLIQQYNNTIQTYEMFAGDETMGEYFNSQLNQIQAQLNDPITLGEGVLTRLIEDVVIAQEAGKLGLSLSEADIQQELEQAFGFYANGTPTPIATATPYTTATLSDAQLALVTLTPTATATDQLSPSEPPAESVDPTNAEAEEAPLEELPTSTPAPTSTPYTQEGFQERLAEYAGNLDGINFTENDLRDLVLTFVLRERLRDALTADLLPEEEQVWARHILVESEEEAQSILDRLAAGEDWSDLAAELSLDTSNKDRGGDLGWFSSGQMVPSFEEAAFALELGEISSPVETDFGYHIIQSLGNDTRPLSSSAFEGKRDQAFAEWLDEAVSADNVERYDDIWMGLVPTEPAIEYQVSP
jgi:peptidyl-prolyl cis-trans isomerase D